MEIGSDSWMNTVSPTLWALFSSVSYTHLDVYKRQLKDIIAMLGLEQLSPEDRNVVARARRLERFLTQPFFTTEQFTGLKGKLVSRQDALDGCERILRDEFKEVPENALYMIGTIDEAKGKAKHQPESENAAVPHES